MYSQDTNIAALPGTVCLSLLDQKNCANAINDDSYSAWATKDTGLGKSVRLSFTRVYSVTCINLLEARWANEETQEDGSKYETVEVSYDDGSSIDVSIASAATDDDDNEDNDDDDNDDDDDEYDPNKDGVAAATDDDISNCNTRKTTLTGFCLRRS